jgi:hypothetical protein
MKYNRHCYKRGLRVLTSKRKKRKAEVDEGE